jgi:hypothetical protein
MAIRIGRRNFVALGLVGWGAPPRRTGGGTGVLTGRVRIDDRPAAEQRVLLISGDMTTLLGSAVTGESGDFSFAAAPAAATVVLLVKIRGPLLALAHRVVDLRQDGARPQEFRFDTNGADIHELRATIATTADWPPYLRIVVDPVHLAGVPAALERFFLVQDERVVEESFFHLQVENRAFSLKAQTGQYRIDGGYRIKNRLMAITPSVPDYVIRDVAVSGADRNAAGGPDGRFLVDLDRDREVTLTIAPVQDAIDR